LGVRVSTHKFLFTAFDLRTVSLQKPTRPGLGRKDYRHHKALNRYKMRLVHVRSTPLSCHRPPINESFLNVQTLDLTQNQDVSPLSLNHNYVKEGRIYTDRNQGQVLERSSCLLFVFSGSVLLGSVLLGSVFSALSSRLCPLGSVLSALC
jgi:hypothetical protein